MEIKFSPSELYYLRRFFQENNLIILMGESRIIKLDLELADKIRDWALEQQQFTGFDDEYRLTREGDILEHIIDKLNF